MIDLQKAFDLDGDGKISEREFLYMGKSMQSNYTSEANHRKFSRIDKNGDGELSTEEFQGFFGRALSTRGDHELDAGVAHYERTHDQAMLQYKQDQRIAKAEARARRTKRAEDTRRDEAARARLPGEMANDLRRVTTKLAEQEDATTRAALKDAEEKWAAEKEEEEGCDSPMMRVPTRTGMRRMTSQRVEAWGPQHSRNMKHTSIIAQHKAERTKWTDPDFGLDQFAGNDRNTQVLIQNLVTQGAELKRPEEFLQNPVLFGPNGPSNRDPHQGEVGDCWFISAMGMAAKHAPQMLQMRFVEAEPEAGIYVCAFCKEGDWVEVMVDDQLLFMPGYRPVGADSSMISDGKLAFVSSGIDEATEKQLPPRISFEGGGKLYWPRDILWPSILEKAYAKLMGGYGCLVAGVASYGLNDLLGTAPANSLNDDDDADVEDILKGLEAAEDASIKVIVGWSHPMAGVSDDATLKCGIHVNHAYSMIRLLEHPELGMPPLLQMRNPWGEKGEWNGAWSDTDPAWTQKICDVTGYNPEAEKDGVFCIPVKDALEVFTEMDISMLYPNYFFRQTIKGSFQPRSNNFYSTIISEGSQYRLLVGQPPPGLTPWGQLVVEQEDLRWRRQDHVSADEGLYMGVMMFKVAPGADLDPYDHEEFRSTSVNRKVADLMLDPGHIVPGEYIIIPKAGVTDSGEYSLTVWFSYPVKLLEV